MVELRSYRNKVKSSGLQTYEVQVRETDLLISTDNNIYDIALNIVIKYRNYIEKYILSNPNFLASLEPVAPDRLAPPIIRDMIFFSGKTGVGPMASVAGAISQYVGEELRHYSKNVIIENGGDDYIYSQNDVHVSIHGGKSTLSDKINVIMRKDKLPVGICTSSGTIGHSLSFGRADAVCVLSKSPILADAAATAIGNRVHNKECLEEALNWGYRIEGVDAVLVIIGDEMGVIGQIEIA